MISKSTYTTEHVNALRAKYQKDPSLLERVLFAFGLLEALARVGLPFLFKGGTSLMLIFEQPLRLSTDIDILVNPGENVDHYIHEAAKIFPFKSFEEKHRIGPNNIEKRHFRFYYNSPLRNEEFYIILDIVYTENPYHLIETREINSDLLHSEGSAVTVSMPSAECIFGDKLTAFAPHTTGVPFGIDKELEIIKQLFDVAALTEKISNWESVVKTYDRIVLNEIGYRNIAISREEALLDTIQSCACIAGKGVYDKEEFSLFLKGIRAIGGHILSINYNLSIATEQACRVIHLASCLLTKRTYSPIQSPERYLAENISKSRYKKLSYMRSQNINAFAHLVEALRNLGEI